MIFWLLPIIAIGHVAIFVAVINRLHGTAFPRWFLKTCDALWYVLMLSIPIVIGIWYLQREILEPQPRGVIGLAISGYMAVCVVAALIAVVERAARLVNLRTTEHLVDNHTHVVSMSNRLGHRPVGDGLTNVLSRLPLNEILKLSVHEKQLRVPRLRSEHHGLRITHLSDLHLTGQLSKDYYAELVRMANQWPSDIVAITGDIVENEACLPWISETLGRLEARLGVYFVLGNHELRIRDEGRVRRTLCDAGMIDAGKRWQVVDHQNAPIVIAGNELPWFTPAANLHDCPPEIHGIRPFRLLLAHSPDQLEWAKSRDCDLMLAGHTHGGQVRLPVIGPILSPSWQGSRFASGTFYFEPTLMHVSRGIAGTRPLRLNCPPELARLVLQCPES